MLSKRKPSSLTLYPFQKKAVEEMLYFLKEKNPNQAVYNACEVGLGKTIQTCEVINLLSPFTTIIICPSIMKLTWERELEFWVKRENIAIVVLNKSAEVRRTLKSLSKKTPSIVIISYDLARTKTNIKLLSELKADLLILDEAHKVANYSSIQTKAILGTLWDTTKYRIALSATPFTTRVVQGFTLFNKMLPTRFPSFFSFAEEFSEVEIKKFTKQVRRNGKLVRIPLEIKNYFGIRNAKKLSQILRTNFYLRYRKSEVLRDLPPVVFTRISLDKSLSITYRTEEKKESVRINNTLLKVLDLLSEDKPIPQAVNSELTSYRQQQGLRKIPAISEYAKDLLDQNIPLVIFCYHLSVIDAYKEALKDYTLYAIDGRVDENRRNRGIEEFQSGKIKLLICQISAGGVGITLTASSNVLFAETTYVPGELVQAIGRVNRIGQLADKINVHYFVVENSLDASITEVVMERIETFKQVLD